jgi:hypothetical protein
MSLNFKSKIKFTKNNLLLVATLVSISIASIFVSFEVFAQTTTPITAPTIDSTTDSGSFNTDYITNFRSPKIRGVCQSGDLVTLYDGITQLNPKYTCTTARFNIQITNVLADGVHPITYTRTNGGVTSAPSPIRNTTIDTTSPKVNVTTKAFVNINNRNIASYPVEGTCSVDSGGVYIPQVSRAPQYSFFPCHSSGAFSAKINFQGVPDGNVTFTASQTDAAGNVSNLYTSPIIVKNTIASPAPGTPSLAPGSDNGVSTTDNSTTVANPTFIGTCNTGETVQLYINSRLVSAGGVVPTSLCTKGAYSITYVTGLALTPSYYRASVAQINSSGNISSNSNELSFYEDGPTSPTPTTAPELATVSDYGSSNTDDITSEVHPKIQGSCTVGDKISLYDQNHGDVQLFPTARCIGGRYDIVLDAALSQGLHKIYQKNHQLVTYCCYNKTSVAGPTFDLTIKPLATPQIGFTVVDTLNKTETSENGTTDTVNIQLNTQPSRNVTISTVSSNINEVRVSDGGTLIFTPQNWNIYQKATLIGADDTAFDGAQNVNITSSVVIGSSALEYQKARTQVIVAKNLDNELSPNRK